RRRGGPDPPGGDQAAARGLQGHDHGAARGLHGALDGRRLGPGDALGGHQGGDRRGLLQGARAGPVDHPRPVSTDTSLGRQGEAVEAVEVAHGGRWPKETIVSLAAFVVLWHLASTVLPPYVAPGWARIGKSLIDIAARPDFVAVTIARVAVALLVSFALGMAL